ncbi:GL21908 [Drosophila persimilis]|uniref:GL21908 n=1 Tax=Drosophila persimilis TaxID=7234 RepID=B4GE16_DROPE|nr:GL21908 [Drosophila persimilis]
MVTGAGGRWDDGTLGRWTKDGNGNSNSNGNGNGAGQPTKSSRSDRQPLAAVGWAGGGLRFCVGSPRNSLLLVSNGPFDGAGIAY